MQNRPDLGREPVGRLLFRLALPTITAQLVNMLYNMVDRIYLGHIDGIGTQALTGVGVCMPLIMVISAFTSLAAMGGAPLASIALGEGKTEKAASILGSCTALLLLVSMVLTAVMSLWHKPLLQAFGATDDVLPYAARYMFVYSLGTVFVQLTMGLNAFITAQGFSRVSMFTVLIGAGLNAALDPLFIFVFNMDVTGAALATIISQAVSCLFVLRFLTGQRTQLRLQLPCIRLNFRLLAPCVALGLSPFIMQSTESLIAICFNTSLRLYGGTLAVSAMTLCTSILQLSLLPLQGLSQGAQPIISYNFGAGNAGRVRTAFKLLLICCLGFSLTLGTLVLVWPELFLSIFTPDAALIAYARPLVRIYMAGTLVFGVQIACQQTFVALGNAKCSLFLAILRKLILLIPLVYILPAFIGDKVQAVFMAEPVADVLAVCCTAALFFIVFRRTMRRMEKPC